MTIRDWFDKIGGMVTKYSSRRYELSLSEIESQALNDVLHDINEYVTDEMFSSPRGLGAFRRILDKSDAMQKTIDNRNKKNRGRNLMRPPRPV